MRMISSFSWGQLLGISVDRYHMKWCWNEFEKEIRIFDAEVRLKKEVQYDC